MPARCGPQRLTAQRFLAANHKPERCWQVAWTLKARVLFALGYGCGLHASEVVRLKVGDIDIAQGIVRVAQSKGRKDRNVSCRLVLAGGRRFRGAWPWLILPVPHCSLPDTRPPEGGFHP
jgi:hypothetical protein